jgi:transposase-like protein
MSFPAETPKTLQDAIRYFSDEQTCIDTVAAMRWPTGPECPACQGKQHYYLKNQRRWKCKECGRQFSVKLGTIFEESPIKLDKWLTAMWLLANCKNGVSSYEIGRALGVTQKSAWFMLQRIRMAMQSGSLAKIGGKGSPVEMDETFVGGKAKNMHKAKRLRLKVRENDHAKTVVFGMLERGGEVRAQIVSDRRRPALHSAIREHVQPGACLHTDEHPGYNGLLDEYGHEVINHLQRYVDGKVHTNGIENFWSLLKRGLNGTYISVEPFHLFRYVDEQVFRFNNRKDMNDADRFKLVLSQIAGKKLTYAELTGKVGGTEPF